jgi:hypothetical protein
MVKAGNIDTATWAKSNSRKSNTSYAEILLNLPQKHGCCYCFWAAFDGLMKIIKDILYTLGTDTSKKRR